MDQIRLDKTRSEITAMISEIERLQSELARKGIDARQPEDREAADIVSRIERKLLSKIK